MLGQRVKDTLFVVGLCVLALVLRAVDPAPATDPDRWYHYAVSRAWMEQMPKALPAAEGVGWDAAFPEREVLFHAVTAAGYWLAGPMGVDTAGAVLEVLTVLALFLLARRRATPEQAAVLMLALVFGCHAFVFRLELLRGVTLAVGCFTLLLWALVARARWVAAAAACAFALSHHAFYLPLGLLALALAAGTLVARGALVKELAAPVLGIVGLAAGVALNPYFPESVKLSGDVLAFAFADGAGGNELERAGPLQYLIHFGVPVAVGLVSAHALYRSRDEQRALGLAIALFGAGLWSMAGLQPRVVEFAVPATLAVAALAVHSTPRRWVLPVLLVAALPGLWQVTHPPPLGDAARYNAGLKRALEVLGGEEPLRVFNTAFDEGTVLTWVAPRARFLDLLDENLLRANQPELAALRSRLSHGRVFDVAGAVETSFQADAVVTGFPYLVKVLEADPTFQRLEPPPGEVRALADGPYVYRRREVPRPLSKWIVGTFHAASTAQKLEWKPGAPLGERLDQPGGLDFTARPERKEAPAMSPATCFTATSVGALPQGDWLYVRGGLWWRVFRGSEVLDTSDRSDEAFPYRGRWVELSHPLEAGEELTALVCGPPTAEQIAIAVSVWTDAQRNEVVRSLSAAR